MAERKSKVELEKMTVKDLKAFCREHKIKDCSKQKKKALLVNHILENQKKSPKNEGS